MSQTNLMAPRESLVLYADSEKNFSPSKKTNAFKDIHLYKISIYLNTMWGLSLRCYCWFFFSSLFADFFKLLLLLLFWKIKSMTKNSC